MLSKYHDEMLRIALLKEERRQRRAERLRRLGEGFNVLVVGPLLFLAQVAGFVLLMLLAAAFALGSADFGAAVAAFFMRFG